MGRRREYEKEGKKEEGKKVGKGGREGKQREGEEIERHEYNRPKKKTS